MIDHARAQPVDAPFGLITDAGKSVWGSGFLPSVYQGVQCRSPGDPVLFLSNPEGVTPQIRRQMLDAVAGRVLKG